MILVAASRLAILGASARAAAWSAHRAGFSVAAVDLFADVDLEQIAVARICDDYPNGLAASLAALSASPWMYTGALENYPDLVAALAGQCPLWGNGADVLRRIRDPATLYDVLHAAGFCCPRWSLSGDALPRDGTWLRKTLRSGGGNGVDRWQAEETTAEFGRSGVFFQEFVPGLPCAAAYVAARGAARLVGVTRQLIGLDWAGAEGFRYAGSLGPLSLPQSVCAEFDRLGQCLAESFRLVGLFGVDAILAPAISAERSSSTMLDGGAFDTAIGLATRVWPIEVNPRYTASIEILERAMGIHAMAAHAVACQTGRLESRDAAFHQVDDGSQQANDVCGKAIVYARKTVVIPGTFTERRLSENAADCDPLGSSDGWPRWADIPRSETRTERGLPILTALARGPTAGDVLQQLRTAAERVYGELEG